MLFKSLLFIVLLSPLPFGSNRPWAWSLWALLIAVLAISWAISTLNSPKTKISPLYFSTISDIIWVFLGVLSWAAYQIFIPVSINAQHPLWGLAANALNTAITPLISLTTADGITAIMRILSYGLVFLLCFYYCRVQENARTVFHSLMFAGLLYSLYGLVIYFGKYGMILWFKHNPALATLNSTFINRNHFATFAGLTLLCSLALLSESITISAKYNIGGNLGWQRFFENLIVRAWLPALVFMITGTALILSGSRGGFFSSLLGVLVLLAALNLNARTRNYYALWLIVIFAGIGTVVFNLSSSRLLARLDLQGLTDEYRAIVFEQTWSAIQTNPWLGFGLGSFEESFPLYKNSDYPGTIAYPLVQDYAHNTYLETLFELGIPAGSALFYCFFRLGWICVKGLWIRKKDWIYPATGFSATMLIACHAFVDFSMQIPAIPYTYLLLMGAACGQSFSSKTFQ